MSRDDERSPERDPGEASVAEKAQAESFGKLVDRLLDEGEMPPAMDSDDRLLVETSTMIVASSRELELPPTRARAIVDEAIERSMLGPGRRPRSASDLDGDATDGRTGDVIPLSSRRRSPLARALPWSIAAAAACAAVLLLVTRPAPAPSPAARAAAAPPSETLLSRPADSLVSKIPRSEAGAASDRLDLIHADRLAGYRERMLRSSLGGTP